MSSRPRTPTHLALLLLAQFTLLASVSQAQVKPSLRGVPNYRFFSAQDFGSGASSVFITTAADGTLFYGDNNWIFLFDGASWHQIYQNNKTSNKITALLWDEDGHIYATGYNSFGELVIDENNQATFKYLVPQSSINVQENFHQIHSAEDAIYLIGRRSFAKYDKKTGAIHSQVFPTWITANFWHHGDFHLLTDNNQILRYENDAFVAPPELNTGQYGDATIADIAVKPNGDLIMASERRGIFIYDGKNLSQAYPKYKFNSNNLVRDIELTQDNRLIIASMGGGITVLDEEGITLEHLGPSIDHRFKSARSVIVDPSGTLWAMFNSSIAKILLDAPLTAIDENLRPSFFYASPHHVGDDYFVRSFYILYRATFGKNGRIKRFENVMKDPDIEVWSVLEADDGLYVNTAKHGIYLIKGDEKRFITNSPEFDRFEKSRHDPNYVIGANANNISLYKKGPGTLQLIDQIENPGGFINRIEEDAQGVFWLEYGIGKAGRITIANNKAHLELFTPEQGLDANDWITIWMHEGAALYTHHDGVVSYDEKSATFKPHPILKSKGLDESLPIERALTDPSGNIWISANAKNLIFWKQQDGTYQRDENSLREMGEPYFEYMEFLENGETLIMTAFEFFHFNPIKNTLSRTTAIPETRIISISDPNNPHPLFTSLGNTSPPNTHQFQPQQNNLVFTVSNAFTYTTLATQFQHVLVHSTDQNSDPDERTWSTSSSANFANLSPGQYTYRARTRLGDGHITPWTELTFTIKPPIYRTLYAYAIYAAAFIFLILTTIKANSRRLRRQNAKLETKVARRTQELEEQAGILELKNLELAAQADEIRRNASDLTTALSQLNQTQDQLVSTARIAGRAEVATNVLHNVGNVLNSINVGLSNLEKQVGKSRARNLKRITNLIHENQDTLANYLSSDERGKHIPEYLDQLADALTQELDRYDIEIRQIDTNVEHIKRIIATQQTHAQKIGVQQSFELSELIESALVITLGDSYQSIYQIEKNYAPDLHLTTDKHLVLDILINVIKNAKEAIAEQDPAQRILAISCQATQNDTIEITVTDNGIGVQPSHQDQLFAHGFTTKDDGHGFGLHSCANAIKTIGGSLILTSPGPQQGATATIKLPTK